MANTDPVDPGNNQHHRALTMQSVLTYLQSYNFLWTVYHEAEAQGHNWIDYLEDHYGPQPPLDDLDLQAIWLAEFEAGVFARERTVEEVEFGHAPFTPSFSQSAPPTVGESASGNPIFTPLVDISDEITDPSDSPNDTTSEHLNPSAGAVSVTPEPGTAEYNEYVAELAAAIFEGRYDALRVAALVDETTVGDRAYAEAVALAESFENTAIHLDPTYAAHLTRVEELRAADELHCSWADSDNSDKNDCGETRSQSCLSEGFIEKQAASALEEEEALAARILEEASLTQTPEQSQAPEQTQAPEQIQTPEQTHTAEHDSGTEAQQASEAPPAEANAIMDAQGISLAQSRQARGKEEEPSAQAQEGGRTATADETYEERERKVYAAEVLESWEMLAMIAIENDEVRLPRRILRNVLAHADAPS